MIENVLFPEAKEYIYYKENKIVLLHGDCLKLLPMLRREAIGVLVTDPPYGIRYQSHARRTNTRVPRKIKGDKDLTLRDRVLEWWGNRPAIVFGTWKNPPPAGTRMTLVWDKKGALGMGALDLPWKPSWEEIYIIGRGFHGKREGAVLPFAPVQSAVKNGRMHPHEKPVSLLEYLINRCPSGVVLDPFLGSGTTAVACKRLGRACIGIEIEEEFLETAVKRLRQEVLYLFG